MNRDAVVMFLALLTLVVQVVVAGGLLLSISQKWRVRLVDTFGPIGILGAAVVSSVCMAGSLYFSEVAQFTPCKLCWYQRIAMYPIAILLVFAAFRRDAGVRFSMQLLAAIGAFISCYHILIERNPQLESSSCDPNNPCSLKWVEKFGYITIPVMALTGFITIGLLLAGHSRYESRRVLSREGI
jgi:disulfide bond formation protein DsbB